MVIEQFANKTYFERPNGLTVMKNMTGYCWELIPMIQTMLVTRYHRCFGPPATHGLGRVNIRQTFPFTLTDITILRKSSGKVETKSFRFLDGIRKMNFKYFQLCWIGLHSQNDGFSFSHCWRTGCYTINVPANLRDFPPLGQKPEKAKNQLFDDYEIVQSAFPGFPDNLKQEYLIRLRFFSSNSCLFASETHLRKTESCPAGQFRCTHEVSNVFRNGALTFSDAKNICAHKSAKLSKFYV